MKSLSHLPVRLWCVQHLKSSANYFCSVYIKTNSSLTSWLSPTYLILLVCEVFPPSPPLLFYLHFEVKSAFKLLGGGINTSSVSGDSSPLHTSISDACCLHSCLSSPKDGLLVVTPILSFLVVIVQKARVLASLCSSISRSHNLFTHKVINRQHQLWTQICLQLSTSVGHTCITRMLDLFYYLYCRHSAPRTIIIRTWFYLIERRAEIFGCLGKTPYETFWLDASTTPPILVFQY